MRYSVHRREDLVRATAALLTACAVWCAAGCSPAARPPAAADGMGTARSEPPAQPPRPAFPGGDPYAIQTVPGRDATFVFDRYVVCEDWDHNAGLSVYRRATAHRDDPVRAEELADPIYALPGPRASLGALAGDVLIVDRGTGPDWAELVVVDLKTGTERLREGYSSDSAAVSGGSLVFYGMAKRQPRPPASVVAECAGCCEPELHELIRVDLQTYERTATGKREWHCRN